MAYAEIDPIALMRLIGTPDAPVVLDLRLPEDLAADAMLIPTSVCMQSAAAVTADWRGRPVVVVCLRGRKISQGAAALMRLNGVRAEVLTGGTEAWRAAGLPVVPAQHASPASLWVTRHRPKVDRIACPWLIRRFVDPAARFLFVPPGDVLAVAEKFGAIPFDIEDTFWTHRNGGCTFDTMLAEFGLQTAALERLATVIRGADTDAHDLAPQAAGLLAFSVGLSRAYRDDLAQLDAAMPLYDALYRWARDGFDEGHDWPAGRKT
jgi:rhodanese-related sulfurtransferase